MSNENSIIDLQFPKLNCLEIHRVGSWKNEGLRQGQVVNLRLGNVKDQSLCEVSFLVSVFAIFSFFSYSQFGLFKDFLFVKLVDS